MKTFLNRRRLLAFVLTAVWIFSLLGGMARAAEPQTDGTQPVETTEATEATEETTDGAEETTASTEEPAEAEETVAPTEAPTEPSTEATEEPTEASTEESTEPTVEATEEPVLAEIVVYVGGVAMKASENGELVAYYVNGGTVTTEEPESWNAKLYGGDSGPVLELRGLEVSGDGADEPSRGAAIFTEWPLNLRLSGSSTVTAGCFGGDAWGIYAGGLVISGDGTLNVVAPETNGAAYGIYSRGNLTIRSGTLNASAGGDGVCGVSMGAYILGNVSVSGDAVFTARASNASGWTCGAYICGDFSLSGTGRVSASAGNSTELGRSTGIWMGASVESDEGAGEKNDVFVITGGVLTASCGSAGEGCFDGAVGFYDAAKITFTSQSQSNEDWYRWKTVKSDGFTSAAVTPYVHKGDWLLDGAGVDENGSAYASPHYLRIEPDVTQTMTVVFRVENGTWADGTTDDISVTVLLNPDGSAQSEVTFPTGMLPLSGYAVGQWDAEPAVAALSLTASSLTTTYTYTFTGDAPLTGVDAGSSMGWGLGFMLGGWVVLTAQRIRRRLAREGTR